MTGKELDNALASIGWSRLHCAGRLACSEGYLRKMSAGKTSIPQKLAAWLQKLVAAHERLPPPADWR